VCVCIGASTDAKRGGGVAVSGPVDEEEEEAEKAPEKERLVYISPAERQIQRECSELHDVLQHSQVRIVAEKTRRHRFLDANRMSRADLLEAKHWAYKERKKKTEAKEAATLTSLNTPRNTVNYEILPVTAGGDDPQNTPASVNVGHDSYLQSTKPMTPKPPTGPRGTRPSSSVYICAHKHTCINAYVYIYIYICIYIYIYTVISK